LYESISQKYPELHLLLGFLFITFSIATLGFSSLAKLFGQTYDPITFQETSRIVLTVQQRIFYEFIPALLFAAIAYKYYHYSSKIKQGNTILRVFSIGYFLANAIGCFTHMTQAIYTYIQLLFILYSVFLGLVYPAARDDNSVLINAALWTNRIIFITIFLFGFYLLYLYIHWQKNKPARRMSEKKI